MVEYFWSPLAGWHALRAEACDGAPEGFEGDPEVFDERRDDPDTIRWHSVLEDSIAEGKPEILPPDLDVVERLWQQQKDLASASAAGGIKEIWSFPFRECLCGQYAYCIDHRTSRQEGEERYASPSHALSATSTDESQSRLLLLRRSVTTIATPAMLPPNANTPS